MNLDAATITELEAFIARDFTDAECAEMCGRAPNGAPRRGVLDSMRDYAKNKRRAMMARLAGNIALATRYEAACDALYTHELANTPAAW